MTKPNPMGSTFAERKAAREGSDFVPPGLPQTGNTTFAERAGKAVKVEDSDVEDKAIKKTAARKPKRS